MRSIRHSRTVELVLGINPIISPCCALRWFSATHAASCCRFELGYESHCRPSPSAARAVFEPRARRVRHFVAFAVILQTCPPVIRPLEPATLACRNCLLRDADLPIVVPVKASRNAEFPPPATGEHSERLARSTIGSTRPSAEKLGSLGLRCHARPGTRLRGRWSARAEIRRAGVIDAIATVTFSVVAARQSGTAMSRCVIRCRAATVLAASPTIVAGDEFTAVPIGARGAHTATPACRARVARVAGQWCAAAVGLAPRIRAAVIG